MHCSCSNTAAARCRAAQQPPGRIGKRFLVVMVTTVELRQTWHQNSGKPHTTRLLVQTINASTIDGILMLAPALNSGLPSLRHV